VFIDDFTDDVVFANLSQFGPYNFFDFIFLLETGPE
jgi:hypothetical protein